MSGIDARFLLSPSVPAATRRWESTGGNGGEASQRAEGLGDREEVARSLRSCSHGGEATRGGRRRDWCRRIAAGGGAAERRRRTALRERSLCLLLPLMLEGSASTTCCRFWQGAMLGHQSRCS